jgi:hypothetical protein
MNEFTRIAMELADAYAEAHGNQFGTNCPPDNDPQAARSALLAHLEGVEQKPSSTILHTETVSAPGAAIKVDVIHLTEEGKRALGYLPSTPTEKASNG